MFIKNCHEQIFINVFLSLGVPVVMKEVGLWHTYHQPSEIHRHMHFLLISSVSMNNNIAMFIYKLWPISLLCERVPFET